MFGPNIGAVLGGAPRTRHKILVKGLYMEGSSLAIGMCRQKKWGRKRQRGPWDRTLPAAARGGDGTNEADGYQGENRGQKHDDDQASPPSFACSLGQSKGQRLRLILKGLPLAHPENSAFPRGRDGDFRLHRGVLGEAS